MPRYGRVVLVVTVMAISGSAFAQGTGEIRGVVLGAFDRPLAGERVELSGAALPSGQRLVERTDSDGAFSFVGLSSGMYDVAWTADGVVLGRESLLVVTDSAESSPVTLRQTAARGRGQVGESDGVATSFGALRAAVRDGDRIRVGDSRARTVDGRLESLDASLVLRVGDSLLELSAVEVETVERRGDGVRDGARRGALAGLVLTGVMVYAGCGTVGCDASDISAVLLAGAFFGGIGAGVGMAVDALIPGWEVIYRRGGTSTSTLRLAPTMRGAAPGVRLVWEF